ncbi:hypothetical protein [Streptomyces sp. MMS24-I29]|uniref:hypothetical protein n=1 Tax=Streptomyces sp. MMS24-I29 TaxID=3351480 RepID=UPI003C7A6074
MNVDTTFLNVYRRGGSEGLKRAQARDGALGDTGGQHETDPEPGSGAAPPDSDAGPSGTGLEAGDPEREARNAAPSTGPGRRGGGSGGADTPSSGATAAATAATASAAPVAETALDEDTVLDEDFVAAPVPSQTGSDSVPLVSLRLTDHQDAVQRAAAAKGSAGGAGAALPQSGFRLGNVKSQPHIKSLPEAIIGVLREQLRAAAVRELGVDDAAAREFSERLSQSTLVIAFLLAQLDLRLDTDPATARAAQLFRSRDPLLGSVASRLDGLEKLQDEQRVLLGTLRDGLSEVRQTSAVIEQAVAYVIADRTENFLRGTHDIHDTPITHKSAVFLRDRARELTGKQQKLERERDGRPIR